MNRKPKTLLNIKLRGTRRTHDVLWSAAILALFTVGITLFGFVQVKLCQDKYPKKTWLECIRRK